MNKSIKKLLLKALIVFAAGCAGGLVNSIVVWLFGQLGRTTALGVNIVPNLTAAWLYPRVVWGGIWGFLFLLPFARGSYFVRGLLYSIGPSLVQLLIVFPLKAQKGLLGLQLGTITPLFVLIFNAVWGVTAAYLINQVQPKRRLFL